MPDPFTIRIFVPDGDPEGVRLIDRLNWTGLGVVFPRARWRDVHARNAVGPEFTFSLDIRKTIFLRSISVRVT